MDFLTLFTYLPLAALAVGTLFGLLAGRYLGLRRLLTLVGAVAAGALFLIFKLTTYGPGEEEAAFAPFAMLTGGMLPVLFGSIMGGVAGRALARRSEIQ